MISIVSTNIISPLGVSSEANYQQVASGHSALRRYDNYHGMPEPFSASLLEDLTVERVSEACHIPHDFTKFEKLVCSSVTLALAGHDIDISSPRTVLIISTTKGNVELLSTCGANSYISDVLPGYTAQKIAHFFNMSTTPVVVSNACISGLSAQILAMRMLKSGRYDHAVVTGADVQSDFIISGFLSFKALSADPCKPFDLHRSGLNLGEAAATMVYARSDAADGWHPVSGVVRNDANHISGPSRTGEGSYLALMSVVNGIDTDTIAFVNLHGTSTLYNDEMESIAIHRAGLDNTPVNSLKGYFGHTMGAAGILECILSMQSANHHTILATRGYEVPGVTYPLNISNKNRATDKCRFIKLLSGFGGCNAAMLFEKGGCQ